MAQNSKQGGSGKYVFAYILSPTKPKEYPAGFLTSSSSTVVLHKKIFFGVVFFCFVHMYKDINVRASDAVNSIAAGSTATQ